MQDRKYFVQFVCHLPSTALQAVYCSRSCQTSDWEAHKGVCGEVGQFEQALPSQQAIHQYVVAPELEALSKMDFNSLEFKVLLDTLRASRNS
jgi:hypothetical protein